MNQTPFRKKCFAMFFVFLGIAICICYFMSYRLVCTIKTPGTAQNCLLKDHLFNLYQSTTFIGDLSGAKIQSVYNPPTRSNITGSYTYNVLLISPQSPRGAYFRSLSTSDHANAITLSQVINEYVQHSTAHHIRLPNSFPGWLMIFPFLLIPAGIVLFVRRDKESC
ncbi:MAG: hypothetical protein NTW08_06740 [Gammaproteobacteria bacterium]|nr:hypothetical protein [Gammaproteobacteria bacterium]